MNLTGTLQYHILAGQGPRVLRHSEEAFGSGIKQLCASFLSDYVAGREAREVRERSKELEAQLLTHLTGGTVSLRNAFGVEPTLVSIADVTFDEAYQKIRTRTSAARELVQIAEDLRLGRMTEEAALEAAMLVSGDVQKRIVDIRGGTGTLSARLLAIAEVLRDSPVSSQ